MKEFRGNVWDYYDKKDMWVVVPTNGTVKKKYEAVMGAGLAKEAAKRFPSLPEMLGTEITISGNRVFDFPRIRIITFPVKHNWWEPADIELIERSAEDLVRYFQKDYIIPFSVAEEDRVVCPRVGCGNGGLKWANVRNVIEPYFNEIGEDKIAIIDRAKI